MSGAYGFPNRVVSEVVSELIRHDAFCKFLYYTQDEKESEILSKPSISGAKLLNKNLFIGRRIPITLLKSGAYVTARMSDFKPEDYNSEIIKLTDVELMVVVHQDALSTLNGTRDCALVSAIIDALDKKKLGGIGNCRVVRVNDIMGLPIEYTGYKILIRVKGFPNSQIELTRKKATNGANEWFR